MKGKCYRLMSKSEKPLEMKWSWNSATQNRIPCLEDVHAKPGRDIVIISRLHGLPGIEFYEGDWWWFSLNFKAPTNPVVCFKRYKIDPQRWMQLIFQNHRWERNQQEVHHSAFTIQDLWRERTRRKANKYFKSFKINLKRYALLRASYSRGKW